MKYSLLFLLCILFFACDKNASENTNTPINVTDTQNPAPTEKVNDIKALPADTPSRETESRMQLSDDNISFDIVYTNGEVSDFEIIGNGFQKKEIKFNESIEAQLLEAELLDLDGDGFSEIYLIFNETSDAGNKIIKGYSSYRNKSAGEIYIKDTDMVRKVNSDKVYVEDKKLMRSFENEKGETVKFSYKLSKGESSYLLEPVKN